MTEYLAGGSLFDLLHPRQRASKPSPAPRLGLLRVLRYAEGICSGMRYLHSRGVIHRDLKSGNLLLDEKDNIKLGAFGVSRRLSSRCESMTAETGTYRWMAPEIILHGRYDQSIDVYSFGIVLWEMFSGELPYDNLTPVQAASAVVEANLRPAIGADVPCSLGDVMRTCWVSDSAKRPTFEVLLTELQALRCAEEERPGSVHGAVSPSWAVVSKAHSPPSPDGSASGTSSPCSATYAVDVPGGGAAPMRSLSSVIESDASVVDLHIVSVDTAPASLPPESGLQQGQQAQQGWRGERMGARKNGWSLANMLGLTCCKAQQAPSV